MPTPIFTGGRRQREYRRITRIWYDPCVNIKSSAGCKTVSTTGFHATGALMLTAPVSNKKPSANPLFTEGSHCVEGL